MIIVVVVVAAAAVANRRRLLDRLRDAMWYRGTQWDITA